MAGPKSSLPSSISARVRRSRATDRAENNAKTGKCTQSDVGMEWKVGQTLNIALQYLLPVNFPPNRDAVHFEQPLG
jgi:hypothetical protein